MKTAYRTILTSEGKQLVDAYVLNDFMFAHKIGALWTLSHRSGYIICHGIDSLRKCAEGAAELLKRHNWDFDGPQDLARNQIYNMRKSVIRFL